MGRWGERRITFSLISLSPHLPISPTPHSPVPIPHSPFPTLHERKN
ncbi:hypothetical protein [Nostoc linckia]|nr:hypothetical protein [Nostoc linckia]